MKDNNTYSTKADEAMINKKFDELQSLKNKVSDEEWHNAIFNFGEKYKRF